MLLQWHQRKNGRILLGGFRNLRNDRGVGVWDDGEASIDDVAFAEKFLHGLGFFGGSGNDGGTGGGTGGERGSGERKLHAESHWTGIIGWSGDGLPFVGRTPDGCTLTEKKKRREKAGKKKNDGGEYVCVGFSGHGMAQTWLAGKAIAEMIVKEEGGEAEQEGGWSLSSLLLPTTLPPALLLTEERLERARKKGSDWFAYEEKKTKKTTVGQEE